MNSLLCRALVCVSAVLLFFLIGCGGSSDHGNGYSTIAGTVIKPDGDPASETRILLMPDTANFAADSAEIITFGTLTDSLGNFTLDSVPYGTWCVSGIDEWSRGEFVLKKVLVNGETTELDIIELSIPGTVIFPVDSLNLTAGSVLYLPGLPIFHVIDTGAIQWIDGIPAGEVELRGYDPQTGATKDLGMQYHLVDIIPGQSLFLAYRLDKPWYCPDSVTTVRDFEGGAGDTCRFRVAPIGVKPAGEFFRFSWGDGTESVWSRGYVASHAWQRPGVYYVQSQMRYGETFVAWSEPLVITIREASE